MRARARQEPRAKASDMVMWVRESRMARIARTRKRVPGGALPHLMPIRRKATPVSVWLLLTGLAGRGCPAKTGGTFLLVGCGQ